MFLLYVLFRKPLLQIKEVLLFVIVVLCVFLFYPWNSKYISSGGCGCHEENDCFSASNGEILRLKEGNFIAKANEFGFNGCGCGMKISFSDNKNYIVTQIQAMDDYWTHLEDCSLLATKTDYAKKVDFSTQGSCYWREKYDNKNKIYDIVIYDENTSHLFFSHKSF